ncbi:hypothetical protein EIP91_001604 [Steccherinum ochraceum]|uniref:Citrate transporter-like domain-containing protein n=1 Tax=Steccherinum ochraceum TaxID=92696 RepID=A0A4R0RK33_9APHY|nr:hypothetical protein EIP91_001604 [Steccherinum ochraceum]
MSEAVLHDFGVVHGIRLTVLNLQKRANVGNAKAILTLVFFLLSNAAVIFPVRIPIPRWITLQVVKALAWGRVIPPIDPEEPRRRRYVVLNFISVPLFSVLLLLATRAIDGPVISHGIVGDDGVKPINILALFISLAYLSISLDFTGLLRFSAFWVARKGGSSGRLLYFYLYAFFLVSGSIVGNDPVILSGTAFLAYFTRVTGITPPTAWIFAQFAAANMASVVLVSSNPTNLVLSGAFSISFVSYTAHVILPFLAAAVLVYPVLAILFFRSPHMVPLSLSLDADDVGQSGASLTLIDKRGALFGSILLAVTLGVLVGTSTVGVPVWEVTVPSAVLMLVRDAWHDWKQSKPAREARKKNPTEDIPMHTIPSSASNGDASVRNAAQAQAANDPPPVQSEPPSPPLEPTPTTITPSSTIPLSPTTLANKSRSDLTTYGRRHYETLSSNFPTVVGIAHRLPVPLVPFAFLMFILVQGLSSQGWVEIFTKWWVAWVDKTGTLGAIGGMGFISCMLCNVCGTNIGATILLARVLQSWFAQQPSLDPRTHDGAIYALALGSNYGAFTLTFSASLAGLLWRQILRQKGIRVRARQFLMLNFPIAFVAMLASMSSLVGEMYVEHKKSAPVASS